MLDFNLNYQENSDKNILTNSLELFLQEIQIALHTAPGDIWGTKYSLNTKRYLFNQFITKYQIQSELIAFIAQFCHHAQFFTYVIEVFVERIDSEELIYVKVDIYPDASDNIPVTQHFLLGEFENI